MKIQNEVRVISSPVVADGKVFFSSGDKYLYAVNANTGQEIWKLEHGEEAPTFVNGVMFLVSMDGCLYALE